jgi:type IV pilus assembly protein PilQ
MTAWDTHQIKNTLLASGLGLAFSLTGAAYAQQADGEAPIGLFDEDAQNADGQAVGVDEMGQIDITVKDLEIAKVLQLLSIQSQRNIVTSRNVSGKVSADLYGVSFHEALDAILIPNGYGYEEQGNFIYVYTASELEERRNALRKTVTRVIRLNYLSSGDAAEFLQPLLSSNGSITATGDVDPGFLPSDSDGGENTFAHADTLLIKDYEENVEEIMNVLEDLDVRPKQVLVEATILQATLTENNAFGIDFAVFANFDGLTDFINPLGAVDELIGGSNTGGAGGAISTTSGGTQTGDSGIKIGYAGSDAAVFLRALDSVTDSTVLAKPNILVLNRQKADILVGERLGYLSTTVTDTSETQTIEFLDVGTQLTVRPFITDQGTIRMELRPAVSDGSTRLEGGFIIPDEITQEMVTNVIVESGQTVVLGGLFVEDTTVGRSQVPILGDIPLLGSAFKGQDDDFRRNEVIFMVKTTIMDHADLALIGDKGTERVNDARIAIRSGLLPFSNDKLTSAHLLNARKHYEAGEMDAALWDVNLALHIAPTSEDAIALKELIRGEDFGYVDQTFFGTISDDMIGDELDGLPMDDEAVEDEMTLLEQSLSSMQEPAASESSQQTESRFVAPVIRYDTAESDPAPADNPSAPQNAESVALTVDTVEELTVEIDDPAASETRPEVVMDELFDPEMVVEVQTDFETE